MFTAPARASRRTFLMAGLTCGAGVLLNRFSPNTFIHAGSETFAQEPLPYAFDALEPAIDKMTMEVHYGRHHVAFIKNLNGLAEMHEVLRTKKLPELLKDRAAAIPEEIRQAVINNGGGHANHELFWKILRPANKPATEPAGTFGDALKSTFGDVKTLAEKVNDAGMKRFGSGWAWLVKTPDGKLEVYSTPNQDSPLMQGHTPVLGLDVWEHAYYLKYQNRRNEYLAALWTILDWDAIGRNFAG